VDIKNSVDLPALGLCKTWRHGKIDVMNSAEKGMKYTLMYLRSMADITYHLSSE